jgi:hypothetical protein
MKLPAGRKCRDCKHFTAKCEWLISLTGDETECDWSPSKFAPKVVPPTDEEICRKFGITKDHPKFATAKRLANNRPDRTICECPMIQCPHCGQEYQKEDYCDVKAGDVWTCNLCERDIHVEVVETTIWVRLCTHPEKDQ